MQRVSVSPGQILLFFFPPSGNPSQYRWSIERCSSYAHLMNNFIASLFFSFARFLFLFGSSSVGRSDVSSRGLGIRVQPDLGSLQIPIDKKSAPTLAAITLADSSDSPTITQPIFFNPYVPRIRGSAAGRDESFRLVPAPCTLPLPLRRVRRTLREGSSSTRLSMEIVSGNGKNDRVYR